VPLVEKIPHHERDLREANEVGKWDEEDRWKFGDNCRRDILLPRNRFRSSLGREGALYLERGVNAFARR
jgi:hypothetical protein